MAHWEGSIDLRSSGARPTVGEAPEPEGESLEVLAAPLNPLDRAVAAGQFYGGHPPLPYVPGLRVSSGARPEAAIVWTFGGGLGLGPERRAWPSGRSPGAVVAEVPDGADPALAAALGIAGLAGWMPFAWRAPVREGDRVLVLGATGTVGAGRGPGGAAARRRPRRRGRSGPEAASSARSSSVPTRRSRSTATSASRPTSSTRSAASRSSGRSPPPRRERGSSSSARRRGRPRRLPSAAIRGKQLELVRLLGLRRPAGRPRGALRAARRARGRRRDPGSTLERVGLDEIGEAWGASGQAGRLLRRKRARLPVDTSRRQGMTELATPPTEQREGLTRISHWIGGKTVAGHVRPDEPGLQPRARGAVRRGRPRDGRGGRRRGRGREGCLPRLARHLAREARGADVQRSASSCTSAARRSHGSSPPSTARCSPTRWARSRAGSR